MEHSGETLAMPAECAANGALRPVVDREMSFETVDDIKAPAEIVYYGGKGGLGKTALVMSE